MGTISDKLMRIINTKEDIRRALISKGYDVPTSIPFKEYAKMILDLPCKVDSFPDIEGIVARYSASGLTNEQMAANPVWVDKTGNGHDLRLKNFLWGEMSGVGGYKLNWGDSNIWSDYITRGTFGTGEVTDNTIHITSVKTNNSLFETRAILKSVEYKVLIKGLTDDIYLRYGVFNDGKELWTEIKNDGIYTLPSYDYDSRYNMKWKVMSQTYPIDCNITIEQLPLYPGALVFDGVDDYGTCDNFPILTKEKGYTVVALRQWDQDFLNTTLTGGLLSTRNYSTGEGVAFEKIESSNKGYWNLGAGGIIDFAKSPFTWQTSKQYNNVGILKGDKNHGKPLCVGCGLSGGQQCGRFAIWELVFLDHDATEEELTKIKDYFVKTYPWLFPYQAWTVTGKTNEDEDRATIANITGNGNDLVLSNFGFAEGSGYNEEGEYAGYLVTDGVDDKIVSSVFGMGKDFTIVGDWKFIGNKKSGTGLVKGSSFYIYNTMIGLDLYINSGSVTNSFDGIKSINAACSDGRVYDPNWDEILANTGNVVGSGGALEVSSSGGRFDRIAFKNLAIYPRILSKDDCIKAYNYLQTIKAK